MAAEVKDTSDYRSTAWRSRQDEWALTHDAWQNFLHVRKQREKYLTKFRKEPEDKYNERLNASVFTGKFRDAIETFAGMALKQDPTPKDLPKPMEFLKTDADGQGNSFHAFLIKAFEMYLRDGNVHIYVTADDPVQVEEGKAPTQSDVAGRRVYWSIYTASQLINHRYERVNGQERFALAVLEEMAIEPEGVYRERHVTKHRILRPGSYVIETRAKEGGEWLAQSPVSTGLGSVPLASAAEVGATPPLLTLAGLNFQHYNLTSDYDNWVHLACVPHMYIRFDSKQDAKEYRELNKTPGVGTLIFGQHAEMGYVQVDAAGMEKAADRIEKLKAEMAEMSIGLLAPTEIAPKTATETLDTAGRRQSKLARSARDFENCIEQALYFTAEQINAIRGPGTVDLDKAEASALKLVTDFERLTFSAEQMEVFENLNREGRLSDETFFEMLQNIVDFPQGWDYETERERIKKEREARDWVILDERDGGDQPGDNGFGNGGRSTTATTTTAANA